MPLHPDADALIRAILDRPADDTPKLVLADWLDDTGRPEDAAWAAYIRTRCEGTRLPAGQPERAALLNKAADHATRLTATLEVPADSLVCDPAAFLNLIPADRLTVRLDGCVLPPEAIEVVPESVARTCRVLSLSTWGETLFLAAADPADPDNRQRMEFILNREVVFLRANAAEIDRAIEQHYPWGEVESVTEELVIFPDPPAGYDLPAVGNEQPVARLVYLILQHSIRLGATWVEITSGIDEVCVRYRVDDVWVDRDTPPRRLLTPILNRIAEMAGLQNSPDGTVAGDGTFSVNAAGVSASFAVMIISHPDSPAVWIERTG
jgi:uncharacterized protein (TIGR02996 family)